MSARTRLLLNGPIVPTLLRLAWPNVLVMLAQASTGLIETWWVSRLGTDALAGMALVFPGFMMMTMLSAGAIGGGISSAVARALGSGRRDDADALVLHALLINLALGLATSALFLVFGRQLYAAMGGRGGSLDAAMAYSNVVFAGNIVLWLMNALASVIRGTGNMLFPSTVVCIGVVLLVPLSPLFIFGLGPFPAMGDRRRRGRGGRDDGADGGDPRLVHSLRELHRPLPAGATEAGLLRRHPAGSAGSARSARCRRR